MFLSKNLLTFGEISCTKALNSSGASCVQFLMAQLCLPSSCTHPSALGSLREAVVGIPVTGHISTPVLPTPSTPNFTLAPQLSAASCAAVPGPGPYCKAFLLRTCGCSFPCTMTLWFLLFPQLYIPLTQEDVCFSRGSESRRSRWSCLLEM